MTLLDSALWLGSECALLILLELPILSSSRTPLDFSVVLYLCHKVRFEFVHHVLSFSREAAEIPGHLGQSFGPEEHQEEEPYEQHLLKANTEHDA